MGSLDADFRQIAIVGVGLIGGSIGLAVLGTVAWTVVAGGARGQASTAARAIGATLSRLPVPWLGSTMIGRWLSCWMTGIAEMSSVLRV